ncbi:MULTISPECIES: flagellar assembly peptidoglycan hydrolase FlgJ [unclassified Pseudoxanthomonas]|uniref:flagellar assembly peptidoglycan hydrolase FlgJ n=1 Tax=unclassified Pseudoxanthomonas TaxID=2645906 RepID=UPI0030787902
MAAPVNSLLSNSLASNSLTRPSLPLADAAGKPDRARIQEVAKQLEGQFAQMLIKCMRDASFGDSLFPGENQTFRDMYDQQLAKAMTQGKGMGLAPMIARQLGGGEAPAPAATPSSYGLSEYRRMLPSTETGQMLDAIAGRSGNASDASEASGDNLPLTLKQLTIPEPDACEQVESVGKADPQKYARNTPERFVAEVWNHAEKAAKELGVDPRALVAQAALETGWGRRGIQRNDGGSSNNLFGIKATGWKGDRVRTGTHEYTNGVKHSETAEFRAYNSPAESFADYVRLLKNNPRYQQALAAGKDIHGFAKGLQKAGYATDPSYANKIASIANGPTLGKVLSAMRSVATTALDTAVASAAGTTQRNTLHR